MSKINRLALIGMIGWASIAIGQTVTAPPSATNNTKDAPKGINRIPPLSPVMSSDEFQSKTKTMTDQNFKSMSQQGYNSVQQQLSALPSNMPHVPSASNASTPPSTPAVNPPAASPAPEENIPSTQEGNPAENPSSESPEGYTGFSSGGASPSQNSTPSQGNEGQLNIHY